MGHFSTIGGVTREVRDELHQFINSLRGQSSGVLWVDAQTVAPEDQEGTFLQPFATIQQALDLHASNPLDTSDTVRRVKRIHVAPGDYDEDLAIDLTGMHLEIIGRFNLGVFDADFWRASTTAPRRNITITGDTNAVDRVAPSLVICSDVQMSDFTDTDPAGYHYPRISGQIITDMSNSAAPSQRYWVLAIQADVYGNTGDDSGLSLDFTAGEQTARVNLQLDNSHTRGGLNLGDKGRLTDADKAVIDGVTTCEFVGRFSQCQLSNDWNVSNGGGDIGTPVSGFISCRFVNAFNWTGAHDLLVDSFSNKSVKAAGVTLTGGAVKVIQGDLTP